MNITAEQAERSHEDKANLTLGVSVGLTVLGFLVVTLRLWCRRLMRSLGWDDLAAVLALVSIYPWTSLIILPSLTWLKGRANRMRGIHRC